MAAPDKSVCTGVHGRAITRADTGASKDSEATGIVRDKEFFLSPSGLTVSVCIQPGVRGMGDQRILPVKADVKLHS